MTDVYGTGTATLSAENTFSDACILDAGPGNLGHFVLSGTWVATVHFQMSFDGGLTWHDVPEGIFTANTVEVFAVPEQGVRYRFGIKTGNYTSGSVVGRISANP